MVADAPASPETPTPDRKLVDRARLDALHSTGLMDSPPEEAFDRLTRLAARWLKVPVSLVSLVDAQRQFFKSCAGTLPEPWGSRRQTPLTHSFCQHAVTRGEPLVIGDARQDPLVRDNRAVSELGVAAYAGIPLVTPQGQVLGAFCAIDSKPRQWSPEELELLNDLAQVAMTEVELRRSARAYRSLAEELDRQNTLLRTTLEASPDGLLLLDRDGRVTYANARVEKMFGVAAGASVGRPLPESGLPAPVVDALDDGLARAAAGRRDVSDAVTAPMPGEYGDGERHLEYCVTPVNRLTADLEQFLVTLRDVTALEASKERLQIAVGAAGLGLIEWDVRGGATTGALRCSDECRGLFGLSAERSFNRETLQDLLHADDRSRVMAALDAANRGVAGSLDARVVWHNGNVRWLRLRIHPQVHGEGRPPERVTVVLSDATDRYRCAELLAEAQGKLRSAGDALGVALPPGPS